MDDEGGDPQEATPNPAASELSPDELETVTGGDRGEMQAPTWIYP